jgi:hypothetical protein
MIYHGTSRSLQVFKKGFPAMGALVPCGFPSRQHSNALAGACCPSVGESGDVKLTVGMSGVAGNAPSASRTPRFTFGASGKADGVPNQRHNYEPKGNDVSAVHALASSHIPCEPSLTAPHKRESASGNHFESVGGVDGHAQGDVSLHDGAASGGETHYWTLHSKAASASAGIKPGPTDSFNHAESERPVPTESGNSARQCDKPVRDGQQVQFKLVSGESRKADTSGKLNRDQSERGNAAGGACRTLTRPTLPGHGHTWRPNDRGSRIHCSLVPLYYPWGGCAKNLGGRTPDAFRLCVLNVSPTAF